jgi:hypothetical protein
MKKMKRIVSMSLAASILSSSMVGIAVPSDSVIIGSKVFMIDQLEDEAILEEINNAIMESDDIFYNIDGITGDEFIGIDDKQVMTEEQKTNVGKVTIIDVKGLNIEMESFDAEKGSVVVSNKQELEKYVKHDLVESIELKEEIDLGEEVLKIEKPIKIKLNGKKIKGNVEIKVKKAEDKVEIEDDGNGGIEGEVKVETENAEVVLDAKVKKVSAEKPFKLVAKENAKIEEITEEVKAKIEVKKEDGADASEEKKKDVFGEKAEKKPIRPVYVNYAPVGKDQTREMNSYNVVEFVAENIFKDPNGDIVTFETIEHDGIGMIHRRPDNGAFIYETDLRNPENSEYGKTINIKVIGSDGVNKSNEVQLKLVIMEKPEPFRAEIINENPEALDDLEIKLIGARDYSGALLNGKYAVNVESSINGNVCPNVQVQFEDGNAIVVVKGSKLRRSGEQTLTIQSREFESIVKVVNILESTNKAPVGISKTYSLVAGIENLIHLDEVFRDEDGDKLKSDVAEEMDAVVGANAGFVSDSFEKKEDMIFAYTPSDSERGNAYEIPFISFDGKMESAPIIVTFEIVSVADIKARLQNELTKIQGKEIQKDTLDVVNPIIQEIESAIKNAKDAGVSDEEIKAIEGYTAYETAKLQIKELENDLGKAKEFKDNFVGLMFTGGMKIDPASKKILNKDAVTGVFANFDALSEKQAALVDADVKAGYDKLRLDYETAVNDYEGQLDSLLGSLKNAPELDTMTFGDITDLENVKSKFEVLDDDLKSKIDAETMQKIQSFLSKLDELKVARRAKLDRISELQTGFVLGELTRDTFASEEARFNTVLEELRDISNEIGNQPGDEDIITGDENWGSASEKIEEFRNAIFRASALENDIYQLSFEGRFVVVEENVIGIADLINNYDEFSDLQKSVMTENGKKLVEDARAAVSAFNAEQYALVKGVRDQIVALPEVDAVTLADEDVFASAVSDYNALSENLKSRFTSEEINKLFGGKSRVQQLKVKAQAIVDIKSRVDEFNSNWAELTRENISSVELSHSQKATEISNLKTLNSVSDDEVNAIDGYSQFVDYGVSIDVFKARLSNVDAFATDLNTLCSGEDFAVTAENLDAVDALIARYNAFEDKSKELLVPSDKTLYDSVVVKREAYTPVGA